MRRLRQDNSAVASGVIAFLVAGVLFMGSVVAVLVTTRSQGNRNVVGQPEDQAAFDIQSAGLADVLLGSPGYQSATSTTSGQIVDGDWAAGASTITGKTANADKVTRLGLLNDPGSAEPNLLNFTKFQNLRRAPLVANPTDGFVNYEEAIKDLGLSQAGLDFHVRAYPALQSVKEMMQCQVANPTACRDNNLKVAYIGDITVTDTTTASGTPPPLTTGLTYTTPVCTKDSTGTLYPKAYRVSTTIHNGGTAVTQFTAVTSVNLGGTAQAQNTNGYTVQPDADVTLFVDLAAISGRSCAAGTTATFDLYDPVHSKLTTISHTFTSAEVVTGATANDHSFYVDTDKLNYRPTDHVTLSYSGSGLGNNDNLFLRVCKGTTECENGSPDRVYIEGNSPGSGGSFKAGNKNNHAIDIGALPEGTYTAWLYDCETTSCANPLLTGTSNFRATEEILVTAAAVGGYVPQGSTVTTTTYTASGPGATEVQDLEVLVQRFCPSFFDSKTTSPLSPWAQSNWDTRCSSFKGTQAQPGDVFPDSKKVMNDDLPARLLYPSDYPTVALRGLPRYDLTNVLVVGSNVDHNAMTSSSAKDTIRDWVLGGGTLLVFGSDAGNVQWLEPIFHSAIRSSSGGISVPDASHPILHTPDELDNPALNYDPRGQAWDFNGPTAQAQNNETTALFTNVIVQGGDALHGDPLLADSKPGAIGNGTIILSSYFPYDLYGPSQTSRSSLDAGSDCPGRTLGQCEALKFMHNLLMSGYGDLYLDYGPPIPDLTNVQPSVHVGQIRSPDFADPVQLTLIVYVFRG